MAQQSKIRVTMEAFEEFLANHREGLYELIEGEIVEKSGTELHGYLVANIGAIIGLYLKGKKIGRVLAHVHYHVPNNAHNCRSIDVSFRRTDEPIVEKGAIEGMPDLAVEIKSPDDSNKDMRAAAEFYIANGCKLVWLVFPEKKMVEVHRPDADFETYLSDETLSGGDVLPDFSMSVAEIFE
jgi:Uma2 family endonuclease